MTRVPGLFWIGEALLVWRRYSWWLRVSFWSWGERPVHASQGWGPCLPVVPADRHADRHAGPPCRGARKGTRCTWRPLTAGTVGSAEWRERPACGFWAVNGALGDPLLSPFLSCSCVTTRALRLLSCPVSYRDDQLTPPRSAGRFGVCDEKRLVGSRSAAGE